MTSKIVVNNIEADAGVSTVTFNSNVVRGNSNLHSTGLNVNNTFVHSTGIALGAGSTIGAVTGVTTYYGDGSGLTVVVQSDTPLGNSTASTIFYEIDNATTISTTTNLSRTSGNPGKIYTKFQEVVVGTAPGTVELVVADGEEFIVDAYQLTVNTKDV